MLVSYNLLNEYVDLKKTDPFKLARLLTNAGLEVEAVRPLAQGSDLVIGQILEVKKHPDRDKLNICQVDVKDEVLQIVCGAGNVAVDKKVIVAKPGCHLEYAKVPVIKKVELGGVPSNGMICSLSELGIPSKHLSQAQLDGIEILDDNYKVGSKALKTLNLDDYIINISLTPNRSDIYSIHALAIEVAALLDTKIKKVKMEIDNKNNSEYRIKIKDKACISYGLFNMNDLQVNESPTNIKNELLALGFTSKNNIVDYANLAMVISGNPIHVFDAAKLSSKEFSITKGITMKDFIGLDNNKYHITKDDLVILNGKEVVAIAGVIGSLASCVDDNTKNIVVESALFDHVSVRNTARRLDLYSEASIRFSKLVNAHTLEFPIALLSGFLNKKIATSVEENYLKYQPLKITVSHEKIKRVLGIDIDLKTCQSILTKLLFVVSKKDDTLIVQPPSYRKDVTLDVDVIEEIIRLYGYDNIKADLPTQQVSYEPLSDLKVLQSNTRNILKEMNLNEIITYQLNSKKLLDEFSDTKQYPTLIHPISEERAYFRDQLLSNMIETIKYNKAYQHHDLALFEISNVAQTKQIEHSYLSIGLMGLYQSNPWLMQHVKSDFYLLKGIIFNLLNQLGYTYGRYIIKSIEANHPYMHPTRSAYIMMGKEVIGLLVKIHPVLAKKHKIANVYVGTLNLTELAKNVPQSNKYKKLNLLPSVSRDLSLVANQKVKAEEIIKVIKTGNSKLVKEINIFDVYHGDKIAKDHYSILVKIVLQDDKQTLTDDKINSVIDSIVHNLKSKLQISLRT